MRSICLLVTALLLSLTAGCSQAAPIPAAGDPVDAYAAIVRWLYDADNAPSTGIFAIDTTGTGLAEPSRLVDALHKDPHYANNTIMDATRAELETQGLIDAKALLFEKGFLIEFIHPEIASDHVTVGGSSWSGGLHAIYATLTARWTPGGWVVDEPVSVAVA